MATSNDVLDTKSAPRESRVLAAEAPSEETVANTLR